jgi:hypothetical protein
MFERIPSNRLVMCATRRYAMRNEELFGDLLE